MRISDWSSDVCSSDLAARFARADAKAHERQPPEVRRHAARRGEAAPHDAGDTDQLHPVPAVGDHRHRNARSGIEKREGETGEQPELGVAEIHLRAARTDAIGSASCRERVWKYG